MISIFLITIGIVLTWVVDAWALSAAAHAIGAPRSGFRWGLLVLAVAAAVGGITVVLGRGDESGGREIILCIAGLAGIVFTIKRAFRLSVWRSFVPLLAYFAMIALQVGIAIVIVIPYFFEAFKVPTRSMAPTIEPGDRFACEKLLVPHRWDPVVYHPESGPIAYCKRLIALPGERLRFENGNIYIDDREVDTPAVLVGRCHAKVDGAPPEDFRYEDGQTIELGPDEWFVIGDNVDVSKDSRFMGPEKRSAIEGVIDLIYWPPSRFRILR